MGKLTRESATMKVMDAITEILKREGISTMFCFPTTPIIESAAAAGIRPVICRQERVGVHMADGCARVMNGKPPGVFAMQYGPGAENAFAGIASAYSDSTPVLLLPLGHPRETAQMWPLFNSTRTYASVTKSVEPVMLPEHIVAAMRRAFNALKNGRSGPVMLEVPADVMTADFAGDVDYTPVRRTRSAGDARDIEDAAKYLIDARSPMIIAGQGVLYAEASDELVALAELLDIPVMTTTDGKSGFPEDHALALGSGGIVYTGHGRHFLQESDVIFAIGTSLTRHNITTPVIPAGKRIIHATNDARDLYKANDTALPILGDAKLVLAQLIEAVKDRGVRSKNPARGAQETIKKLKNEWLGRWEAKLRSTERPLSPYFVMSEFMRVIPSEDAIVTHDSGSPRDQLLPFYVAKKPRGYMGWGKSHQLGTGLGLAIGAKVGAPDKFCVNFMGDAAFGMTGLDFETAARSGIPMTTIVLNNSTMAIETHAMAYSHEKYRTRDLGGSYANIAKDLGGWSERVDSPAEVGNAILRARRQNEDGRAALLEFITSAETAFS
ncbi:MAG TPA: thiamine pyrophosphate-requiring protein, partial [Burkholderiales bacterium]